MIKVIATSFDEDAGVKLNIHFNTILDTIENEEDDNKLVTDVSNTLSSIK